MIFEIGSITKVFTATVLADMVEEGLVGLDDPVNLYLREGAGLPVRGRPITLRDLATHASGLPRLPKGMLTRALRERPNPYASFTVADLERATREARLRREPGTKVRYSNFGAGLLGHALALRTGQSYAELVDERISRPLSLSDTAVAIPDDGAPRFAVGHSRRGRPVHHCDLPALAGARALRSTAADLLRFLELQLDPPATRLGRAAARTHEPLAGAGRVRWCLGWMLLRGRRVVRAAALAQRGHRRLPELRRLLARTGTGVVVLSNCARSVDAVGFSLLKALGGER